MKDRKLLIQRRNEIHRELLLLLVSVGSADGAKLKKLCKQMEKLNRELAHIMMDLRLLQSVSVN